ncbi:MAG: DHH family phosphoesterase [Halobacteriota archaeon]
MVTWLMLGAAGVGHTLVESIDHRSGALQVVEPDEAHVEQLRTEKIDAVRGDITDEERIASLGVDPAIVIVAGADVGRNRVAATVARSVYPDSYIIAFAGEEPTRADVAAIEAVADRVFDPGEAFLDHLSTVVRDGQARRLRDLHATLAGIDGRLGIFTHDNPDPDAIASAVALAEIADYHGVDAQPAYFGRISHQENRAFVNLLDLRLEQFETGDSLDFDAIALVDHSTPGVNDQLPADVAVDIVFDHHPSKRTVTADFVDVRESVGATSTLLVDYLRGFHIDIDVAVATALLYGIRVDTNDFARGITAADFDAAAFLIPYADIDVLKRIESPSISADTFEIIARAIRNRDRRGNVLTSCVGSISDRDALAQAADRLLNMENIGVTLVYGYMNGTILASGRARGVDIDLGETLRIAFDDLGSAGGHPDMAGMQIPLGLFEDIDAEEELTAMVEDVVTTNFFDVVDPDELEE